MDFPTTLDVLLTRLHALEKRVALLEAQGIRTADLHDCRTELDTALTRLGAAIKKVRYGYNG